MASSAVEATVASCAAEASALGFTCTWHDRATGAPATGPRASLTLRLAHESAEDAVHVDFLPVLDRVQIFAECGARRARCDVAAGAPGAGRRFAVHVLQPLVTGGVADETLLGLPESVRRVIYELLPAPAVGLVAEAAKPLREEASSDAVWMRLLRRDAEALLALAQNYVRASAAMATMITPQSLQLSSLPPTSLAACVRLCSMLRQASGLLLGSSTEIPV
mgnify:CR=1 FL=1